MIMQLPFLLIKETAEKGRGVFTTEAIEAETIIEISPVVVMEAKDRVHLDKTLLHDYIFEWGPQKTECCMALGLIPIYNHSYASNCEYYMDFEENMIMIKSVRDIDPDEELTINYNGDWNDERKVWFEK
ncbi:MAG TPA: SET domain-containing protein [Ferruginibacter sp.]|nr:SET domain-containing protein [Ferruginibacter sp.]